VLLHDKAVLGLFSSLEAVREFLEIGGLRCIRRGTQQHSSLAAVSFALPLMKREYPDFPLVGVGAIIIEDGRVLLVKRGHPPLAGEWSIPGGVLEVGEPCAKRQSAKPGRRPASGLNPLICWECMTACRATTMAAPSITTC